MAETKYIVFSLGQQKYSMKLSRVNGIEQIYNVVPIPVGARFIKGMIHLRDNVIPIYNLKEHFNIPDEGPTATRQLLIAESHEIKMGFEVDEILGIIPIDSSDIKEVPDVVRNDETGYLENIIKVTFPETGKVEIMISINVDKLMSDNDFENVRNALEDKNEEAE
ncbi:MAG: chemotaxis protein CheW [Wujia sp.]